jgi:hypothetical protein
MTISRFQWRKALAEVPILCGFLLRHWNFSMAHQWRKPECATIESAYREKHGAEALRQCATPLAHASSAFLYRRASRPTTHQAGGGNSAPPGLKAMPLGWRLASESEWRFSVARGGASPDRRDVPFQSVRSSCLARPPPDWCDCAHALKTLFQVS